MQWHLVYLYNGEQQDGGLYEGVTAYRVLASFREFGLRCWLEIVT